MANAVVLLLTGLTHTWPVELPSSSSSRPQGI